MAMCFGRRDFLVQPIKIGLRRLPAFEETFPCLSFLVKDNSRFAALGSYRQIYLVRISERKIFAGV
jgi:hypothetical protein